MGRLGWHGQAWGGLLTSSRRLRNSGRKCWCTACNASLRATSCALALVPASSSAALPRLLVRMTIVLAKDTVRPLASVRRPSSKTPSSTLSTSGWAFSTSSSSTTLYGRRLDRDMQKVQGQRHAFATNNNSRYIDGDCCKREGKGQGWTSVVGQDQDGVGAAERAGKD